MAALWRMLFLRLGSEAEAMAVLEAAFARLREAEVSLAPDTAGRWLRQHLALPGLRPRFADAPPEVRRFLEEGYPAAELAIGPAFYTQVAEALGLEVPEAEPSTEILGYLSGELDAQGEQDLRHRTDQDEAFRSAFEALAEAWEGAGLPWPLPESEAERLFDAWQQAGPAPRRRWPPALMLLAGSAALALAAVYAWQRPAALSGIWQGPGTYPIAGGEVSLSEAARLRLAGRADSPRIELAGGAYQFRLSGPFAAQSAGGGFTIRSLGESCAFHLHYDPLRHAGLRQQEGRIQVSTPSEQFVLMPGDSLILFLPQGLGYKYPLPKP
jgi:hypothetical protein